MRAIDSWKLRVGPSSVLLGAIALGVVVLAGTSEKILYEGDSPYTHIIVSEDERGFRSLLFEEDGALQSVVKPGDPDHLELPYAKGMLVSLAFVEKPERILIVGLGGATLPNFLHKHFPKAAIDVVDIDPDVVKVAKRFFEFREDELLKAHVADGRRFIERRVDAKEKPYDMIFLDAYSAENIPEHLATLEFLRVVRKALSPRGVVFGNVWGPGSNELYDAMVFTYQEAFDETYVFDIRYSGNKILVGAPRPGIVDKNDLLEVAERVTKAESLRFDLAEVVSYGYRHVTKSRLRGRILQDP